MTLAPKDFPSLLLGKSPEHRSKVSMVVGPAQDAQARMSVCVIVMERHARGNSRGAIQVRANVVLPRRRSGLRVGDGRAAPEGQREREAYTRRACQATSTDFLPGPR